MASGSKIDLAVPVQAMLQGQLAFDKDAKPLMTPMTQGAVKQLWDDILKRDLHRMRGFGLLIQIAALVLSRRERASSAAAGPQTKTDEIPIQPTL